VRLTNIFFIGFFHSIIRSIDAAYSELLRASLNKLKITTKIPILHYFLKAGYWPELGINFQLVPRSKQHLGYKNQPVNYVQGEGPFFLRSIQTHEGVVSTERGVFVKLVVHSVTTGLLEVKDTKQKDSQYFVTLWYCRVIIVAVEKQQCILCWSLSCMSQSAQQCLWGKFASPATIKLT